MRIVLCTETYLPILNGVVTFVQMLADEWTKQGHAVLVIAPDHKAKKHFIKDGVLHCPAMRSKQLTVDISFPVDPVRFKLLKEFAPDIIHIQHEWGISLFGLQSARLLHIPLVYTLHSEYSKYMFYAVKKFMIPWATVNLARLERFIVKHATVVTSPSRKGQEYFRSIGVDLDVTVIQNSVQLDDFNPDLFTLEDKQALRTKLGIGQDEMCVLFVGRLGPEKSVKLLLDYWAQTIKPEDKLRLMFVGSGTNDAEVIDHAKNLGIASMVTFCGKVPHDKIAIYYAICDVYATASISEMHSVSMLEGLGAGLPVLQRLDELNRDQLIEGVNGYFFETAEEFGRLLKMIRAQSPEEVLAMKHRVRQSVLHNNSPKALADKYMEQYKRAIEIYVQREAPPIEEINP